MAAAASEEEQGKMVEIVPAAPDPDQQQDRDAMEHPDSGKQHAASQEAEDADEIEELLGKLQDLCPRISQLLGPHRHRVVTGDFGRRCLDFMEKELSSIETSLTTLKLNPQHFDKAQIWMERCWVVLEKVDDVLPESDPLYLRVAQCFCSRIIWPLWQGFSLLKNFAKHADRRTAFEAKTKREPVKSTLLTFNRIGRSRDEDVLFKGFTVFRQHLPKGYSYQMVQQLYHITEGLFKYGHLLVNTSDLGLTPQLAQTSALSLVGIDHRAKKLLRWLTTRGKMDESLRVMCIVGPVGIGKTTLAVELHNQFRHEETSGGCYGYFQCNIMAQVSQGTDRSILLLQDILSQVSEPAAATAFSSNRSSQAKTMEALVHLVSECLRDKRYFVIIDDIHEASDWEEIKEAFPTNILGSRILITTHVTSIAVACCSSYSYDGLVHKMKPLNEIDSERLLQAKVVGSINGCIPENMKLFCDEILRRCDGIPLFLTGMADWLIKEQLQQQQRVDEDHKQHRFSIYYKVQVPQIQERLEQLLSSAFNNDFPNNEFRSLSFYMSMFPYGYKFDKDRLIRKLRHESLVSWSEAETFFSQLVDINVINCVAPNCRHYEAEACQWHVNHIMHQFLASKSAEMGFIFTTATLNLVAATATGCGNETSGRMPRRLALHHPDPQLPSLLETMDLSQTRSLSVSGAVSGIPLDKFVNLVVLDLEGWENLNDEDLVQVCRSKMIFLSYLSIRNTRVRKLPHEIKLLRILQTLDISYTHITELPLEVFKIRYLKHLDMRGTQISQLPKQIVGLHHSLFDLLVSGEEKINSVATATRLPHDLLRIHRLRLQILATVDLTEQPASFIRALGDLGWLRVLAVTWSSQQSTDKDSCEALRSSIGKWRDLESLTIHCGLGCSMEFLGSLEESRAPPKLKKFKVTVGTFACIPQWIHGLEHLAFVQITVCNKQATDDLKILGALPSLQCLILGLDFMPGQDIVIEDVGFRQLMRFVIYCPIPWLTFSTGAMPMLTYLQMKFCAIPTSQICVPSGISNLRRLTEVALCYNAQYINSPSIKMTVDAVTKQVAEHHNPIDLFINGIEQDDVQQVDDEVTKIIIGTSSRTNAGAEDDTQAVGEEATAAIECEITEAES